MPVQNIVHLIDKMYQAKISADEVDDRQKHRRESLPVFIKLFLITEFGLKSIADKNMKALVAGVHQFSREEEIALGNISVNDRLRILVFGEMAGMGDGHYSCKKPAQSSSDLIINLPLATKADLPVPDCSSELRNWAVQGWLSTALWTSCGSCLGTPRPSATSSTRRSALSPTTTPSAACTPSLPPPVLHRFGLTVVCLARAQL